MSTTAVMLVGYCNTIGHRGVHPQNAGCIRWQEAQSAPVARQVNIGGVFSLFEQAIANKLKYPKIRLQTRTGSPVVLARAGVKSKYTGQVLITDGAPFGSNIYFGRVGMDGVFYPSQVQSPAVIELLERLSADPVAVASEYGRLTGHCCFCELPLKDARSTAVGYGPVCAEKFGLAWG